MRMMAGFALAAAIYAGPALANRFDDCVVESMRGVTSDLAAKSVKVACLRKAAVEIPSDVLSKIKATANYGEIYHPGETGFLIELDNQTDYVLTEITLSIRPDKAPERIVRTDDFWTPSPPDVVYTSGPPDPTVSMQIKPYAAGQYWVPTKTAIVIEPKRKASGPGFAWSMLSARGIPTR
jgi:hypothetical protein